MTYDDYKLATPPSDPFICEGCGRECEDEEIIDVETGVRYVYTYLCKACHNEYMKEKRAYEAELIEHENNSHK